MDETKISAAFMGFPNVGKSTIFNLLTGLKQHTGNWTGKTVELSSGSYFYKNTYHDVTDLPGTYSLSFRSEDEKIAAMYVCTENPDVVVIVCDALCLERNLSLVLQILQINTRCVLCLNFSDCLQKSNVKINVAKLEKILGIPVVKTDGRTGVGIDLLKEKILISDSKNTTMADVITYGPVLESCIEEIISSENDDNTSSRHIFRWAAIRLLCGDTEGYLELTKKTELSPETTSALENSMKVISASFPNQLSVEEIFSGKHLKLTKSIADDVVIGENTLSGSLTEKIDKITTSKKFGIPIMLALLCLVFYITITFANYPSQFLSDKLFAFEEILLNSSLAKSLPIWVSDILILGVYRTVAWVISVMLPPMAIFFPLFTLLEDLGYLPRVAFNLDGVFYRAGCCGKQSLTACMGFGCNAAAIVGCRIISSPKEKLIAILTNVFVPCNGRFPTIIAIICMFFACSFSNGVASLVSALLLGGVIVISIILTLFVSKILSSTILKEEQSEFILELPPYRKPKVSDILVRSLFDRTLKLLARAVIVSIPAGFIIWVMANVSISGQSLLYYCIGFFEPLGKLMGLDGVILISFILGFPANEIVVPIMIMAYTNGSFMSDYEGIGFLKTLLIENGWTIKTAICAILFTLAHFPCATTCLTIKKETGSNKNTLASIVIPTICGIVLCIAVNIIITLVSYL